MSLFDLDNDNTVMNIDGKDIEMKPAICFGKVYDKWLVSKCAKVWSLHKNRQLSGQACHSSLAHHEKPKLRKILFTFTLNQYEDWWGDGSGQQKDGSLTRLIPAHKMVIDTWAPLYDNPPVGIIWEEWEIVRDLPSVYNHISKTVCIDHIDDNPANNHLDNLRRVTTWDNQSSRKAKGI